MSNVSINTKQVDELIAIVMRQTNHTYETAKLELEKNDNNYMKVIKESLGITEKKPETHVNSVNQTIYKEIRGLMDDAASTYRHNQEKEIKRQEYIQRLKKKQLEEQKKENKQKINELSKIEEDK